MYLIANRLSVVRKATIPEDGMLAEFRQCVATLIRKSTKATHIERWQQASRLDADWSERVSTIASLVAPHSTVLEFGAGHQILRTLLPDSCTYIASDVVARNADTFVCDLNAATLPTLPKHDIAVFSGVLEYIYDIPRVIEHLRDGTETIVVSYAVSGHRSISSQFRRLANGWVNAFCKSEFEQLFETRGYRRDAESQWNSQWIWRFRQTGCSTLQS